MPMVMTMKLFGSMGLQLAPIVILAVLLVEDSCSRILVVVYSASKSLMVAREQLRPELD